MTCGSTLLLTSQLKSIIPVVTVSVCDLRTHASDRHVEDEEPKSKLDKK